MTPYLLSDLVVFRLSHILVVLELQNCLKGSAYRFHRFSIPFCFVLIVTPKQKTPLVYPTGFASSRKQSSLTTSPGGIVFSLIISIFERYEHGFISLLKVLSFVVNKYRFFSALVNQLFSFFLSVVLQSILVSDTDLMNYHQNSQTARIEASQIRFECFHILPHEL